MASNPTDDALILAGYDHASRGGFPGDCRELSEADRLLWVSGFMAFYDAPTTHPEPTQMAKLRARAAALFLSITSATTNDLEILPCPTE